MSTWTVIGHKSFCLLETCPKQWDENNKQSGHNYSTELIGTKSDPFNVFEGNAPLMKGTIEGSTMAKQIHAARANEAPVDGDANPSAADEPSEQPTAG